MKINKITLNNIRSYTLETIVFPSGSILLSGDVGSGKTTILLAIEHAFFGLQPGQRGSSLLSNKEDEGSIILECDIDNNQIVIERKLKRGSKTISQDYASLTINGFKEELSVTELKIKVLNLLGYPEDFLKKTNILYRYTVYSPQEEMKSIILEEAEKRIDLLRHIFGVDKYKKIKDNLSIVALKLREKSKLLQIESNTFNEELKRLENYEKRKLNIEKDILKIKSELKTKKDVREIKDLEFKEIQKKLLEKQKLETEIEKTLIVIANKSQIIKEKEKELLKISQSQKIQPFNQDEYSLLINDLEKLKKLIEEHNQQIISHTASIQSLSAQKSDALDKKNRIFRLDLCPTCLQDVSDTHKHNILNATEASLVDIDKRLKELNEKQSESLAKIEILKRNIISLEDSKSQKEVLKAREEERKNIEKNKEDAEKTISLARKDISLLEEHITSLKHSLLVFSNLDAQINIKEKEKIEALSEEKMTELNLAGLSKEFQIVDEEIKITKEKLTRKQDLIEQSRKTSLFEQWLSEDFTSLISTIERNIMANVRKEFSRLFNKWFSMLTTDSFSVNLDENFTPVILQGGFEIDYAYLSGGERTAIALAYRLALNHIINLIHSKIKTKDLLILDEPTDGFSEQQLDKIRDILKELAVEQLIIVSHERKIESFVDNIIKIRKENQSSLALEQEQKI